jgi:hypothetical protein
MPTEKGGQQMRRPRLPAPCAGLAAGCLVLGATGAVAATPDMQGTWRQEATAIVTGAGGHHPADAPPPAEGQKPRLRPFVGTLRVTGQEGERFWGTVESPPFKEDIIGIFTGEAGGRFLYVDTDGFAEGSVGEDGTARYCYWHVTATSRVISCGIMTRE